MGLGEGALLRKAGVPPEAAIDAGLKPRGQPCCRASGLRNQKVKNKGSGDNVGELVVAGLDVPPSPQLLRDPKEIRDTGRPEHDLGSPLPHY